jgi:diguanylate cyclase (GGDEF)-like protein
VNPLTKKILFWTNDEMSQDIKIEHLTAVWPKEYTLTSVSSYNQLLQACAQNPIAVIIADSDLSFSPEALLQIKSRYPDILRFVYTHNMSDEAIEHIYSRGLAHKALNANLEKATLFLQIREIQTMIELVAEKNKFLELSITDPVTQLTNHRFFQQKFRQELNKAKQNKEALCLMMIDVDHFKLFNDQFGHPQGDIILAMIATEIKRFLPPHASASRYGGEEFAVLLPKHSSKKAFDLAEQLRLAITKISSIDFRLSVSTGIANYPEHGLDTDEILTIADHALYCAKRQGRNITVVAGDSAY